MRDYGHQGKACILSNEEIGKTLKHLVREGQQVLNRLIAQLRCSIVQDISKRIEAMTVAVSVDNPANKKEGRENEAESNRHRVAATKDLSL